MTARRESWYWFWLALFGFAASVGGVALQSVSLDRRPPVIAFYRSETMNSPVQAGGELQVRVWRDKVRNDCPLGAEITVLDGNGVVWNVQQMSSMGALASQPYADFQFQIPADLAAGQYIMTGVLSYACPGIDLPFVYTQPVALFRVDA